MISAKSLGFASVYFALVDSARERLGAALRRSRKSFIIKELRIGTRNRFKGRSVRLAKKKYTEAQPRDFFLRSH